MLKKITKCNKGKISIKALAFVLAIIITFSNFTLLGSCIRDSLISYATDTRNI